MCGIAGIVDLAGNRPPRMEELRAMCDSIYHRGPDQDGMELRGPVAIGMRRLSIIDLAGGRQPITNEDGTIRTVFNGEIYNFRELRDSLRQKGHVFTTNCDTEVIVHLYEEYGTDFPKYLNGMFAIALSDERQHRFLLVRDHIGIKPLFYSFSPRQLVFGSEIKAILAANRVERQLDYNGLGEFISWEYVPGERTLFSGIAKLPPAHFLDIDLNAPVCRPTCYWDLAGIREDETKSQAEWCDEVDAKLKQCVSRQLVSDVPLGAFLSGGVDSSLIVAAMGRAKTFSIGFDDPSYNELPWARRVAAHLGVDHADEIIRPDITDLFGQLMHFMDDPIGDFSIFPTYLVSKVARKHVTVSLSGDGGDELFGGYETYLADGKARQYAKIPKIIRHGLIEPLLARIRPRAAKKGLINKAKRFAEGLSHPEELSHARWRLFVGEALRQDLFTPEAQAAMSVPAANHITNLFKEAGERQPTNRSLYVDLKSYLVDNCLVKVDRMSMAVSLEARVPFLDPEMVELAFRMPDRFKVDHTNTKILLKQVAARHVPHECVYRKKEGFSIPIKHWLCTELKPLMEDLLQPRILAQQGVFHLPMVARLKEEHLAGLANHSHILWSMMVFQAWRQKWLGEGTR